MGVNEDLSVLRRAFAREPARGPGDYKIEHTSGVSADSVGHGKRVPVEMLPPTLLSTINDKLTQLGYPVLDRSWNTIERAIESTGETVWTDQLQRLMDQAVAPADDGSLGVFALVVEERRALRWVIDVEAGTIVRGDGDVDAVMIGTAEDLVLLLTNQENVGTLVRSGRVRYVVADEGEASRRDVLADIRHTVDVLRSCIRVGRTI